MPRQVSENVCHCCVGKAKDKDGNNDKEPDTEDTKLKPGHLPVTDWRVFDQRFLGYYTWLEPPLQPKAQKCENCGIQCLKVHRCVFSTVLDSFSEPKRAEYIARQNCYTKKDD